MRSRERKCRAVEPRSRPLLGRAKGRPVGRKQAAETRKQGPLDRDRGPLVVETRKQVPRRDRGPLVVETRNQPQRRGKEQAGETSGTLRQCV